MPADNQLGGHGDMWSHCFPEGIVNAASPNHLWFQCLGHDADLQINSNGTKQLIQNNWYKTEIAQYLYKWCFFYIYYQTENMNRKGIMWVKASEGTAMPCGFTRHPQHGMGKSPSKCYNVLYKWIDTWFLDSNRRVGVWSLPWRWHILSIPLTTGRGTSAETCGLDDVFPPDDLGSRPEALC